jgi:hypothetical protein
MFLEAGDHAQQRRLAAARRADQHDELAVSPSAEGRRKLVRDIHSFARPNEARVTHVELDLMPTDFAAEDVARRHRHARRAGRPRRARDRARHQEPRHQPGDRRRRPAAALHAGRGRLHPRPPLTVALPAGDAEDRGALRHQPRTRRRCSGSPPSRRRGSAPVPVLAGRGDPHPHLDPHAGQPRHPADVRRAHHRSRGAEAR